MGTFTASGAGVVQAARVKQTVIEKKFNFGTEKRISVLWQEVKFRVRRTGRLCHLLFL